MDQVLIVEGVPQRFGNDFAMEVMAVLNEYENITAADDFDMDKAMETLASQFTLRLPEAWQKVKSTAAGSPERAKAAIEVLAIVREVADQIVFAGRPASAVN